ncbi:hypothetical protein MKZ08_08450 [Viridibacillus sp. FSL R5-0477]|uniref:Collagen-like protein n=1 Tax=Viridibacillus arenosi FSL R5-213 TaxID=1227360 RepID=W4EUH7_9BACL
MPTKDELKEIFSTGKKPTGADFAALIDGVEGPAGAKGATGAAGAQGPKGDKGDTGAAGKDGFGTKAQYDDIISRLATLEST